MESGTIRRCAFVGVGVALLEEICLCGGKLGSLPPSVSGYLQMSQPISYKMSDSQLLLQYQNCLHTAMLSIMMIVG